VFVTLLVTTKAYSGAVCWWFCLTVTAQTNRTQ